jgi:hypothetical protein
LGYAFRYARVLQSSSSSSRARRNPSLSLKRAARLFSFQGGGSGRQGGREALDAGRRCLRSGAHATRPEALRETADEFWAILDGMTPAQRAVYVALCKEPTRKLYSRPTCGAMASATPGEPTICRRARTAQTRRFPAPDVTGRRRTEKPLLTPTRRQRISCRPTYPARWRSQRRHRALPTASG